nr:peptidyl-tRNA hydrolase [Arsenicicoccus dermatophilus]
MQLVVRYDKRALPDADLVCATAARAVVTLLADPRSADGEWAAPVTHWRDGRIRKLVRRARGTRWDRVQSVPGVTVEEGRAAVRACVPGPARPLPPELDVLQVSGTTFPQPEPEDGDVREVGRVAPVVTLATSPHADMTTGKAAAQCGHGAQLVREALRSAPELAAVLQTWAADGYRVQVTHPDEAGWARLAGAPVSVTDAGFTELDGPTETIRAWWS